MFQASVKIRKFMLALAAAVVAAGVMAGPALADDWGHRDGAEQHWRDRDDYRPAHYWRDRDDYRPPVYVTPYAVVAPPARVAVVPAPAISFFIPLHFR